MPRQSEPLPSGNVTFDSTEVTELLLLIGDASRGGKAEALDALVEKGLAEVEAHLESALRDGARADLRNGAMEIFVRFGGASVPVLTRLLSDPDEEIRNFSTVMLGEIASRDAVPPLIESLRDPDVNVRHGAAEALGRIGDHSALQPLLKLLKEDFWLQYPALAAIQNMGDSRAIPYLLPLLDDALLGQSVAEALGAIGDSRAIPPLSKKFLAGDYAMAVAALQAIAEIGDSTGIESGSSNPLVCGKLRHDSDAIIQRLALLKRDGLSPSARRALINLLGWLDNTSALSLLLSELDDELLIEPVVRALVAIGPKVIPALREHAGHPDSKVRIAALSALFHLGEEVGSETLKEILASENETMQSAALSLVTAGQVNELLACLKRLACEDSHGVAERAIALLAGCPPDEIEDLYLRLVHAPEERFRVRSTLLMAACPTLAGQETLRALLTDPALQVRVAAVFAASRCGLGWTLSLACASLKTDAVLRDAFLAALGNSSEEVPTDLLLPLIGSSGSATDWAIARAMGHCVGRQAAETLLTMLACNPASREVVFEILNSLATVGGTAGMNTTVLRPYLADRDFDLRRLALKVIASTRESHSLDAIRVALLDSHWSVRVAALRELAESADGIALSLVVSALSDHDLMVRRAAAQELARFSDIRAAEALMERLDDPDIGSQCAASLRQLGPAVLHLLHELARSGPDARQEFVVDAIGKIGAPQSTPLLLSLLDEPHPALRMAALDALWECADRTAAAAIMKTAAEDTDDDVRYKAGLIVRAFDFGA